MKTVFACCNPQAGRALGEDHQEGRAGRAAGWAPDGWLEAAFETRGLNECWPCPYLGLPCTSASSSLRLELVTPSSRAAGWTHVWEEPGMASISSQECHHFN